MIVLVGDVSTVIGAYESMFAREGYVTEAMSGAAFGDFCSSLGAGDLVAVEGILICEEVSHVLGGDLTRRMDGIPKIVALDNGKLDSVLTMFEKGADDVVRKPVHVREILARMNSIRRRGGVAPEQVEEVCGRLAIRSDGRDVRIDGEPFPLPRREQRILEYLSSVNGRRVSRAQIFTATYGMTEEHVEESVVESHISKLRKKLRGRLGFDPIESKRFLGYRLKMNPEEADLNEATQSLSAMARRMKDHEPSELRASFAA